MTTRLNAVIIEKSKTDEDKTYSSNIGSAFMHEDNKGLDLKLISNPVDGKFSLFLPKENEEALALPPSNYFNVYTVESKQDQSGDWNNWYHKIGAAFLHSNSKGLQVELFATPIVKDGFKTVIRAPMPNDEQKAAE